MKKMGRFLGGLLIAAFSVLPSIGSATLLKVDLGQTGQDVQAGFVDISGSANTVSVFYFSGIGISISGDAGSGYRKTGNPGPRPQMTGALGDLAEDFFFSNTGIQLKFTGLTAGNYSFTSWSHDSGFIQSTYKIAVNGTDLLSGITATTGASPAVISSSTLSFYSDGVGSDDFLFFETANAQRGDTAVILNGFTLQSVPEPGTVALLGLGLLGLAASRKRK